MAMSRSRGGTSLTRLPPIQISPSLISSSPAIMRRVVDLPQPDGPTSTTNSWSAISRSMPFTACTPGSYSLMTLRSETCAMTSALRGAGGQAGDVIVHQEGVDDHRWRGGHDAAGHDLAPLEHVAADQVTDDADRQHHLIAGVEIGHRVEELAPA